MDVPWPYGWVERHHDELWSLADESGVSRSSCEDRPSGLPSQHKPVGQEEKSTSSMTVVLSGASSLTASPVLLRPKAVS